MNRDLRLPLLAWATGALFFFYAWVLRVAPSVMIDELMRDFGVSGAVLGNLSAFYFYGYAGVQIPVGLMLDRFGPRRLMTLAALACACGCVLFATGTSFWAVAAGRFLIGASAAFSLVGSMAVAGQWFPANRFALLGGLAMMMGMAGGVFGQAPLRLSVEAVGWRSTVLWLGGGGLIIAAMAWLSVRDRRRGSGGFGQVLIGLSQVARQRQTWLIALAGLGAGAPLLGFASLWGVPYLGVTHGLDTTRAAAVTSTMGHRRAAERLAIGSAGTAPKPNNRGPAAVDDLYRQHRLCAGSAGLGGRRVLLPRRHWRIGADRRFRGGAGA